MNAQAMQSSVARQLVSRLSSRLENEKAELVMFLIELADFDAKKLALELGYPSTLGCLVSELRMSESSACRRIAAARLLARLPQVVPHLRASRLSLTALVALKDVLDESNVDEVLQRAAGLSESEVRQLALRIRLDAVAPSPAAANREVVEREVATPLAAAPAAARVATPAVASPQEERMEALTLRAAQGAR